MEGKKIPEKEQKRARGTSIRERERGSRRFETGTLRGLRCKWTGSEHANAHTASVHREGPRPSVHAIKLHTFAHIRARSSPATASTSRCCHGEKGTRNRQYFPRRIPVSVATNKQNPFPSRAVSHFSITPFGLFRGDTFIYYIYIYIYFL